MKTQQTVERMADQLLRGRGENDMPAILCKRFVPHKRTYRIWDASWEGLKRKSKGGKIYWEIVPDFNMPIEIDGLCLIPDTPNNRKRLEKISKPVTSMIDKDPVTGIIYNPPKQITHPPIYQRADNSMMEQGLVERLLDAMTKLQQERAAGGQEPIGYAEATGNAAYDPELEDENLVDEFGEAVESEHRQPTMTDDTEKVPQTGKPRRRGRPRKEPSANAGG